ncbi:recombinase family protein [Kitasatospora sp. NPDC051914]|uniref:recombinase family protein n=1 Tax=Kitasatospora sp. NPDC051914 TaxID=3154945 RepID=UPI0034424EB3
MLVVAVPASAKSLQRAIIYIRVSTEREEMQSPEQQRYSCEQYAKRNGIKIVGEPVEDLDLSGTSSSKRQISAIIGRVRSGEANIVLVWKWSRFGRNIRESQVNLHELEKAGGRLIAATEDYDTDTYHGRFSRDNMLLVADLQAGIIGATWQEAHDRRHRAGLPHTGQARFGYMRCPDCRRKEDAPEQFHHCRSCDGVLVVDPVRGPALGEAYERYVAGASISGIARDMKERGIRSLSGAVMKPSAWQNVMDSGFAAGLIRWRGPEFRRLHGRAAKKPDTYDNWAPGRHVALISMDVWEAYKKLRQNPATIPWSTEAKYAYSGLLRCAAVDEAGAKCNRRMTASALIRSNGGAGMKLFRCPGIAMKECSGVTITLKRLDSATLAWLGEFARGADMGLLAMKRSARRAQAESDIPSVRADIAAAQSKRKKLLDLYLKDLVSEDDYRETMEQLAASLASMENRLAVLEVDTGEGIVPTAADFGKLLDLWPRMTPDEQRAALSRVVAFIEIEKTPGKQYNRISIVPRWEVAT